MEDGPTPEPLEDGVSTKVGASFNTSPTTSAWSRTCKATEWGFWSFGVLSYHTTYEWLGLLLIVPCVLVPDSTLFHVSVCIIWNVGFLMIVIADWSVPEAYQYQPCCVVWLLAPKSFLKPTCTGSSWLCASLSACIRCTFPKLTIGFVTSSEPNYIR